MGATEATAGDSVAAGRDEGFDAWAAHRLGGDAEAISAVRHVLRQARKLRRRARIVGAAAVLVFLFTFASRLQQTASSNGAPGVASTVGSLFGAVLAITAIAYALETRRRAPAGVLVWMRHFRPSYSHHLRFYRALGHACDGVIAPVTIQDRSFNASIPSVVSRGYWALPGLVTAWFIPAVIFGALTYGIWPAGHRIVPAIGAAVLWTVVWLWAMRRILRRIGYVSLTGEAGLHKADAQLAVLTVGAGSVGRGVEVLKCDNGIWQDVIRKGLQRARVGLVDVTDPTVNVAWELEQAMSLRGADGVLLCAEEGIDMTPVTEIVDRLPSGVRPASPAEWVEAVLVRYPATRARHRRARHAQYRALTHRLRWEIAARVAASPAVEVSADARRIARRTQRRRMLAIVAVGALGTLLLGNLANVSYQENSWDSQSGRQLEAQFINGCETHDRPAVCQCWFDALSRQPPFNTPLGFETAGYELASGSLPSSGLAVYADTLRGCVGVAG